MKVAHFAQFAPHGSGQYGTVRDLILAERKLGIDAQLIDASTKGDQILCRLNLKDGELSTVHPEWAKEADVLVRHSIIPFDLEKENIPVVMCLHGRPENSFILHYRNRVAVFSELKRRIDDPKYMAFVTFWKEYIPFLEVFIPREKLYCVSAPVDMDIFKPDGKTIDLGEGKPNILIADLWREDITPFNLFFAVKKFKEKYCKDVRLHVFGLPFRKKEPFLFLIRQFSFLNILGHANPMIKNIDEAYRSADMLITPHHIATRVIRESLASGTPIVAGTGCRYTKFTADPRNIDGYAIQINRCWKEIQKKKNVRKFARETAEKHFDPDKSAKGMLKILETVVEKHKKRSTGKEAFVVAYNSRDDFKKKELPTKVFIDLGGHLGESIFKFYTEIDDARSYKIYSFEPHPVTFKKLQKNVGYFKNVNLIKGAAGRINGKSVLYLGEHNEGEGSTLLTGKETGGLDYTRGTRVKVINFCDWLEKNTSPHDFIVLKINIEGGEYDVLNALIDGNLIERINELHVMFHADRFKKGQIQNRLRKEEDKLIGKLKGFKNRLFITRKGYHPFECKYDT